MTSLEHRTLGGVLLAFVLLALPLACKTAGLSPEGAKVAVSRNQAPAQCKPAGYITGKGGGTFGGGLVSNEDLIEYAMNDLRNKAAELDATFVQHDPPQLGSGDGTTTSVTITGTAYRCQEETAGTESKSASAAE